MNDELPTDERLRRIERGVERRIGARRLLAQRIAVGATAVVLVAGGVALIGPVLGTSSGAGGSSAAGSAAPRAASGPAYGSAASGAAIAVRCHGTRTVTADVDPDSLPASALAACARAARGAGVSSLDDGGSTGSASTPSGPTPSASPATSTLCRTTAGALHVYPGPPAVCATHGMSPYAK